MNLKLNNLKPAAGAKRIKMRVGRGIGCGSGKTCGRGHKGQTSRSGYSQKIGFEGGQMPLQRRLPKFGFNSLTKRFTEEVRLDELNGLAAEKIDLSVLKDASIISVLAARAKVILSGDIKKPIILSGISVTKGARKAIEDAGGRIEE